MKNFEKKMDGVSIPEEEDMIEAGRAALAAASGAGFWNEFESTADAVASGVRHDFGGVVENAVDDAVIGCVAGAATATGVGAILAIGSTVAESVLAGASFGALAGAVTGAAFKVIEDQS